jgi:flavin reductase (DIM6/NTAB) family NADH-FMN oxidoreductase RutF/DNA-binding IclR family transcriptional regulator
MNTSDQENRTPTNPKWFRQVLGQYPTGVCVITGSPGDKPLAGMVVGSFTSVSLDPPLVAFLPDRGSTTWPRIQAAGKFCVNILGAEQERLCRQFAAKSADKFEGVSYRLSTLGAPILNESVAWLDCEIVSVNEAGDHYIVVGRVHDLQIESGALPLLFFQGGYGRFSPLSLLAVDPLGAITEQLRNVDTVRLEMEQLASELSARCIATTRVEDELVITAGAGSSRRNAVSTLVGQRLPFIPPTCSVFAAWWPENEVEAWLRKTAPAAAHDTIRAAMRLIRERGYSVGLINEKQREFVSTLTNLANHRRSASEVDLRDLIQGLSYDPEDLGPSTQNHIRVITAPVFGPNGEVVLALTAYDFPKPPRDVGVRLYIDNLLAAAQRATRRLGGVYPTAGGET